MSTIEHLDARVGLLYADFDRGLAAASRGLDRFEALAKSKLGGIEVPAPRMEAAGAAGPAGQADQLAASILPLAGKIQSSIVRAMAPLNSFASRFSAQFDAVGGTIIAISRRIDSHLKFPLFQAGVEKLRGFVRDRFVEMEGSVGKFARFADRALGGIQGFSKLQNFLSNLGDVARKGIGQLGQLRAPDVNFDNSTRSVYHLKGAAEAATGSFRRMAGEVALALGAFGLVYKAVGFLKGGIRTASDLNETINKTDTILEGASPAVKAFADDLAARFGIAKGATLDTASALGGLAKSLGGLSGDQLAGFSRQFTMLAADLSSIANIDMEEAGSALRIGLSGNQSDKLKELGVVLTEATLKQYAYAHGIAGVGKELDEQQKFQARAGIIAEKLAFANGDLARTIDDPANAYRRFTGTLANLATTVGSALMPAIRSALGMLNGGLGRLSGSLAASKARIEAFSAAASAGLARVAALASRLAPAARAIGSAVAAAFAGAAAAVGPLLPSFATFAAAARVALESVAAAVARLVAAVRQAPDWIDRTFGPGSAALLGQFALGIGAVSLAMNALSVAGGIAGGIIAALTSPVTLVTVGVTAAVAAVGYFTGAFSSAREAIDLASYGFRNFGALAGIAFLKIGGYVDNFKAVLATIPTNLGIVAAYVRDNWLTILGGAFGSLVGLAAKAAARVASLLWRGFKGAVSLAGKVLWELPGLVVKAIGAAFRALGSMFSNLGTNLKNFGKAIVAFLRNPTKGFDFNWPKLIAPELKGVDDEIKKRFDAIGKDEEDLRKKLAEPLDVPRPATPPGALQQPPGPAAPGPPGIGPGEIEALEELSKFAEKLKESTKTPLEEYREQVAKIGEAFSRNLIDEKTGKRGLAEAEQKLHGDGPRFAGALQAGSTDARSAVLAALTGRANNAVADNTRTLVNQGQAQTGLLASIKSALERTAPTLAII